MKKIKNILKHFKHSFNLESPNFLGMDAKNKSFIFSFIAMLSTLFFTLIVSSFLTYPFYVILKHTSFNGDAIVGLIIFLIFDIVFAIPLNVKYWNYIENDN